MNYCWKCGSALSPLKGRWFDYYVCERQHLWRAFVHHVYLEGSKEWTVEAITWASCQECGQLLPKPELTNGICSTCDQHRKESWRMDSKKSYARLRITPIVTTKGKYYHCSWSIEVRPYPNPFMFGGSWGSCPAYDEKELEEVIAAFSSQAERWKGNGLEIVEIQRCEEEIQAAQPSLTMDVGDETDETNETNETGETTETNEPKPVQLSFM